MIPLAGVLSAAVCLVARRVGRRAGLMDEVGGETHKGHDRPVPNTGGVGLFVAIALPLSIALLLAVAIDASAWARWSPELAVHVPGFRTMAGPALAMQAALALLHGVGLVDDRRALGPWVKFAVQVVAAILVVGPGQTRLLALLDQWGLIGTIASYGLSVVWLVVIVNALNFLDNMDGLTAGVCAIVAGIFLAAALISGQWFVGGLSALLLGACLGFLVFNRPPASLFMGDGGSLVLGLTVGVISMRSTYWSAGADDAAGAGVPIYALLTPLVVLAVPLYDFVSVTVIRLRAGLSPLAGDHNHFSHRLTRRGLTRPQAVGVIWLCTLATGLGGVVMPRAELWQAWLIFTQTLAVLALIHVLERGEA